MILKLERSSPETLGINSQSIVDFINAARDQGIAMHSLMILRHGMIAAELYWKPYSSHSENHVYSFSKTLTSIAVGFAVKEKRLDYSDRLCSFFPRYIESSADERMYSVTIEHLLTMTSGMMLVNEITSVTKSDWIRFFLNSRLSSFPGEKFCYNSLNTYMLSAVIRKVTGMGLVDYLTPRLFEPLGINGVYSDKCPMGRDIGGWGLHLKTEDMAKIGQLLLNKGKIDDIQLLPEEWVKASVLPHADTTADSKFPPVDDVRKGYGYQLWLNRDGKSFRADGMLGQFAIVLPEKDSVIVSTAGNMDEYAVLNLIWDKIVPAIDSVPENTPLTHSHDLLCEISADLSIINPEISIVPFFIRNFNNLNYVLPPNRQSLFPFLYRYSKRSVLSGIDNFRFTFGEESYMTWTECETENSVPLFFDGKFHDTEISFFGSEAKCSVYSYIKQAAPEEYSLEILLTFTDTPHSKHLFFTFKEKTLHIRFNELPDYKDIAEFAGSLISSMRNISPHLSKLAGKIAEVSITAQAE